MKQMKGRGLIMTSTLNTRLILLADGKGMASRPMIRAWSTNCVSVDLEKAGRKKKKKSRETERLVNEAPGRGTDRQEEAQDG
jgi:hypothetical protein